MDENLTNSNPVREINSFLGRRLQHECHILSDISCMSIFNFKNGYSEGQRIFISLDQQFSLSVNLYVTAAPGMVLRQLVLPFFLHMYSYGFTGHICICINCPSEDKLVTAYSKCMSSWISSLKRCKVCQF